MTLETLSNPWVVAFIAPVLASALTIFCKWTSKNDAHARFTKEDAAIGQELAVTAIAALITATPGLAQAARLNVPSNKIEPSDVNYLQSQASQASLDVIATTLLIVLFLTLCLWVVTTVVRKVGWSGPGTLRFWPGFMIPLAFGSLSLFASAYWIASYISEAK